MKSKQIRYVWTWRTSLALAGSILAFLTSSYIMIVASNYASYRSPSNKSFPILPDLGFELIPQLNSIEMTDALDNILLFSSIMFIIIEDRFPLLSFVKLFACFSITYLLRSSTVALTSFPDPRMSCERIDDNLFTTIVFHRCGDCMFSGHAAVGTLFSLYWYYVEPKSRDAIFYFSRAAMWLASLAEFFVIISNRSHYTVDVVMAIYVSIGVWFTFNHFWDKHVTKKGRLVDLTDPHRYWATRSIKG